MILSEDLSGDLEEVEQALPYAVGPTHKTLYKTWAQSETHAWRR